MWILADPNSGDETIRSLSCLVLKNNIKRYYHTFPNELKNFMKERSLQLLSDSSPVIRATVGLLISSVAGTKEILTWTELFPTLGTLLSSSQTELVESTFVTLLRLCEDHANLFLDDPNMITTLRAMLPRFLEFCGHPSPKVRNHALLCINQFVGIRARPMMELIDRYVEALHNLANDENKEVKKNVCRSLVSLFENHPAVLHNSLDNVIQYMIARSRDEDSEIALEACEFWLTLPESPSARPILKPYLPDLIPFLMEKMRHSQEDIEMMRADLEEDYMVPDKDDDIRPRHYRGKGQGAPGDGGNSGQEACSSEVDGGDIEVDEDEDDDDSDWDGDANDNDESEMGWNIRKCAAGALDCFAHCYGEEILPIVFGELDKTLRHEDWIIKEGAVLTIGAIAEGTMGGMEPHLHNLVPFLVEHLSDKHPLVRSITCWTLGRYTSWLVEKEQENFFKMVMSGLLKCILDNNKKVQEAACSAFATLSEGARLELVPYIDPILSTLVQAFNKYQQKNLLNLYDAIGTLAETVKGHLNNTRYIDMLLPPLIAKWNSFRDDDPDLFPLLECLSCVTVALGSGFKPYSQPVFKRCESLIDQILQQGIRFGLDPENIEPPNKDFMIAALDLLSGLAEGLGGEITESVASSNVIELMLQCINDPQQEVRQSSFALLGDLSKACFPLLAPHVERFMHPLVLNMRYKSEELSVCNNATWAAGEIALQMQGDFKRYATSIMQPMIASLNSRDVSRTLLDNTTITIGRVALVCPEEVAPSLVHFIEKWCISVKSIRPNDARDQATLGICGLIKRNPHHVIDYFHIFCDTIISWHDPKPELKQNFYEILHTFKGQAGEDGWQEFRTAFTDVMWAKLTSEYGL